MSKSQFLKRSAVAELAADIGRVEGEPKNILAVDINANNVTAGDDTRMVQFDLSGAVDYIMDAKTRGVDNSRRRDDLQYIRKVGRRTSYQKEEARREEQKVTCGSTKLHQKLKHRCRSLKKKLVRRLPRRLGKGWRSVSLLQNSVIQNVRMRRKVGCLRQMCHVVCRVRHTGRQTTPEFTRECRHDSQIPVSVVSYLAPALLQIHHQPPPSSDIRSSRTGQMVTQMVVVLKGVVNSAHLYD